LTASLPVLCIGSGGSLAPHRIHR